MPSEEKTTRRTNYPSNAMEDLTPLHRLQQEKPRQDAKDTIHTCGFGRSLRNTQPSTHSVTSMCGMCCFGGHITFCGYSMEFSLGRRAAPLSSPPCSLDVCAIQYPHNALAPGNHAAPNSCRVKTNPDVPI